MPMLALLAAVVPVILASGGPADVGPMGSLTFRISLAQRTLLPMEPMQVTLSLANETPKALPTQWQFVPSSGGPVKFTYWSAKGPDGDVAPNNWPHANLEAIGPGTPPMPAGKRETLSATLTMIAIPGPEYPTCYHLLPEPGTCKIMATLTSADGRVQRDSNTLTITAAKPEGEDAKAYEYLKDLHTQTIPDAAGRATSYYGFLDTPFAPHFEAKQEEFIKKFPTSRYALYVYYALGYTYAMGKGGGGVEKGMEYLEKAGAAKDFPPAAKALGILVETCIKRGDLKKAQEHLATLKKEFPGSPEIPEAESRVDRASRESRTGG